MMVTSIIRRRNLHGDGSQEDHGFKKKGSKSKNGDSCSTSMRKQTLKVLKILGLVYLLLNLAGCVLIYMWPTFMSHMIFQTFIYLPFKNLTNPADYGIERAYSFKLEHDDVLLGAWHMLPKNAHLKNGSNLEEQMQMNIPNVSEEEKLKGKTPPIVILYLHGNTNDRSTGHRLELYKLLTSMNYHVIAVDYRGYGDSTGEPTEIDVVRDALFTYEFIQKTVPWATVYVWGHSLGTGITSSMARMLTEKGKPAKGIVLEAPFFSIVEEVELHPFTWLFWPNKILLKIIEGALKHLELQFRSDIHLTKVTSKIMMLHAEDDFVIPIFQADKLYEVVSKKGISQNLTYHRISFFNWCGHRNIYSAPNITQFISEFIY